MAHTLARFVRRQLLTRINLDTAVNAKTPRSKDARGREMEKGRLV